MYEQRDAAEYFEKILCLTSLEAAKVIIYLFIYLYDTAFKNTVFQCSKVR